MIHAIHGETNITLACQNNCVGCNHFVPVQKPWFIDSDALRVDLFMASRIIHFERYNLVGGEPTLHQKILDLLNIVRDSDISDTIEITSNGQGYKRWTKEFYFLIDELVITPYKLSQDDLKEIERRCNDANVIFSVHPVIFTAPAYKQNTDEGTAHNRYKQCWYNANRHVIDGGYFYRCCTSPFIPNILMGLPKETDGIALDGLTEERLQQYLDQDETPKSCYRCASNNGPLLNWHENDENWMDESLV